MSMITLLTGQLKPVYFSMDKELPKDDRFHLLCRSLTAKQQEELLDDKDQLSRGMALAHKTLEFALGGWGNAKDSEGNILDFPENVETAIDMLPIKVKQEAVEQILEQNELTEEKEGNSSSSAT